MPSTSPACRGVDLHRNTYVHITGVDIIRNSDGDYYVLEDNLRTPSGSPTCWKTAR